MSYEKPTKAQEAAVAEEDPARAAAENGAFTAVCRRWDRRPWGEAPRRLARLRLPACASSCSEVAVSVRSKPLGSLR